MAKAELGDKQVCPTCGTKFYDLRKRPAICPKCQAAFDPTDELLKLKRVRAKPVSYETEATEDEEEGVTAEAGADEDEAGGEDTKEIDAESPEDAPVITDEDDEESPSADALPAGFSEAEEDVEDVVDDDEDGVPILEDDDEEFDDDDLAVGDDDEER